MQDLISRQAAIDALNEYFARIGKLKRRGLTKGEKAISLDTVGVIKTMPSAQPEIIRCKDCKHQTVFHYTDKRFKDPDRYVYGCDLTPDGCYLNCFDSYCSEAERRTDGKST